MTGKGWRVGGRSTPSSGHQYGEAPVNTRTIAIIALIIAVIVLVILLT
jgi:hypothetical protein